MTQSELQEALSSSYNQTKWIGILSELMSVSRIHVKPISIPLLANDLKAEAFQLASFDTSDGRVIGVYQVDFKVGINLQRNRVSLRNLLRNVYKYDVDGAIIVFNQDKHWRFSFVSEI